MQDFIKRLERAIARNMFFSLRWIISRIPYPLFWFFAFFFNMLGHIFMNQKKKLAIENLQTAFSGEKTKQEIEKISSECFNYFGKGMIDLIYFLDRPQEIIDKVRIEGKEILDEALSQGKGVILVSAHFGSFVLMYLRIILEGYKTNVIMRRTRDSEFEAYISNFRKEKGINTIYALPPKQCVQKSLKALRNNEILFILLDQNFGGEGRIFVDFFGQKAATAAGPVVFATRTESPILPIFIMRDNELMKSNSQLSRNKIVIYPFVEMDISEKKEETILKNIQKLTKIIEDRIKEYPYEWGGWMHKRWKSKIVEEQRIIDRQNQTKK